MSLEGHYPSLAREEERTPELAPAFAERPSTLIAHAVRLAHGLDAARYRPNASVFHRWNERLGLCEVSLAGTLLAGETALAPDASADAVWAQMLRRDALGPALRAMRELGIGDVHDAVLTLACYDDNRNGRITCKEARAHGIAPVPRGHPAYPYMHDGDGDGVVCE